MKKLNLLVLLIGLLGSNLYAQKQIASPKAEAQGKVGSTGINIHYGSPSVKNRKIWGGLVPNGEVWRAGANEATTVEFSTDVTIKGQQLAKGKYAFFVIPAEKGDWTVIFNKKAEQWGAYDYDKKDDALRIQLAPGKSAFTERLTYAVTATGFVLRWENLQLEVPVTGK